MESKEFKLLQKLDNAREAGHKGFAVLIDPDKAGPKHLESVIQKSHDSNVDYFFVGGSLLTKDSFHETIRFVKQNSHIPLIIFPGGTLQIDSNADAIFFLSLISGRNPDLLIGRHIEAAPFLSNKPIEVIPTGYILIDGGAATTVSYISNTTPIPQNKPEIAVTTALAGQLLGMRCMYMDAGSGAQMPINEELIFKVSQSINVPLIVGGGIDTPERAIANCASGADVIVVGNAIEKDKNLLGEIANAVHANQKLKSKI